MYIGYIGVCLYGLYIDNVYSPQELDLIGYSTLVSTIFSVAPYSAGRSIRHKSATYYRGDRAT